MHKRILLALAVSAAALAWFAVPREFVRPLVALNRSLSGLTAHSVRVDDHDIAWLDGGEGEPVVLLHGIFAEKDHWVEFARVLTGRYRVIIPDLAGFGESSRLDDASYAYAPQVERLHAFLEKTGARRVHLAGNSMGGTIAALYAARYPHRVASLAFIGAPHGIRTPDGSEGDRVIESGGSPLIVRTPEEFDAMMRFLFVQQPFLPRPIYVDARTRALGSAESNERLWKEQLADRYLLDGMISAVTVPTLALWGAGDRMFHASGIERLREALPQGEFEIIPAVGHLPMMEQPRAAGERYRRFLEDLPVFAKK